ncbi:DNA primase domain protein [Arthrobacter phage SilentRX]|uniref:DNA primase domain protein n=1 Tax=Arthrobacter phage SilentRX TaxID=2836091 RepID=A0A8F3EA50_9CAUD|nr:DNA primase domain protein [Arthrobacter phage SilentRX]QWY82828.1 DNA primase domain protein [Arthrobacter phage SilentRX]
MPEQPPTLIHFARIAAGFQHPVCGAGDDPVVTANHGQVTCFACRRSTAFRDSRTAEGLLRLDAVVKASAPMQELHRSGLAYIVKRGLNSGTNDGEHEALVELADALGLVYDEETDKYR